MTQHRTRRTLSLASGETLAYVEAGEGPDLLLIHGAIVTADDMRVSLLEPLAERFHVVAFDRPGHGMSTRPRFASSLSQQAETIVEGCRSLALRRPVVVGHSLGATLAIEMALSAPDCCAGVVAIAPIAFPEPRVETMLFGPRAMPGLGDWALNLADGVGLDAAIIPALWRAMFLPQRAPAAFRDGMSLGDVQSSRGLLANGEDAISTLVSLAMNGMRYGRCDVPIAIVNGDRDLVVNPWVHAKPLARILKSGSCDIVPGRGHMLHHFEADLILRHALDLAGSRT